MSYTTKLRGGWIAIDDGCRLEDSSSITFRRIVDGLVAAEYDLPYHVIHDFFADQIGFSLEEKIENLNVSDIVSVLIDKTGG